MENAEPNKFRILTVMLDSVSRELMEQEVSGHQDVYLSQVDSMKRVPDELEDTDFDILLLDIDGADVELNEIMFDIRRIKRNQAFIVLTSDPTYETVIFSMGLGALDYFRKPLDRVAVSKIMNNHRRRINESGEHLNLNGFVTFREVRMDLPTDINILPQAANKITAEIYSSEVIEADQIYNLNLAILECLTNALEHGNLQIGYDKKTELIKTGDYLRAIKDLSAVKPFCDRIIKVRYTLRPGDVIIEIEDEGDGFDVKNNMDRLKSRSRGDYHGRGIILAMNMVDEVSFNDKGNRITLKLARKNS